MKGRCREALQMPEVQEYSVTISDVLERLWRTADACTAFAVQEQLAVALNTQGTLIKDIFTCSGALSEQASERASE